MGVRPLIGVTKPDRGDVLAYAAARLALSLAGARVTAITAAAPGLDLALDGLMLGGGSDVHPPLFRAAAKSGYAYDLRREAMELDWLRRAWEEDLPTLGVCRGAQLMNVAAGGALHLDVAETFQGTRYPDHWAEQITFRKHVTIEPDSLLGAVVGGERLRVNSIHRQAASHLGEGLRVSAREANGAIQAIEDPSRRFWLGVQFHPEFLIYRRRCRRIFEAFTAAAAAFAETRRRAARGERPQPTARRRGGAA